MGARTTVGCNAGSAAHLARGVLVRKVERRSADAGSDAQLQAQRHDERKREPWREGTCRWCEPV